MMDDWSIGVSPQADGYIQLEVPSASYTIEEAELIAKSILHFVAQERATLEATESVEGDAKVLQRLDFRRRR